MRILVVTERLEEIGAKLRAVAMEIEEVLLVLRRAWADLDWETRQASGLEARFVQVQRQASELQEKAEQMERFLRERAVAFAQADAESSAFLAQTAALYALSFATIPSLSLSTTFPFVRAEGYAYLGALLLTSPRDSLLSLAHVPVEAEERRALIDFDIDFILSKTTPLETLRDRWDMAQVLRWKEEINQAIATWEQAQQKFGLQSPQAQTACGHYLETLFYKSSFFGVSIRAFINILKIIGSLNPIDS